MSMATRGARSMGNPNVDQTLFGGETRKKSKKGNTLIIVGKDTVQVRRPTKGKKGGAAAAGGAGQVSMIAASELNRIKETSVLRNKEEEAARQQAFAADKEERQRAANMRKEKMMMQEEERKAKMAMQMTDFEQGEADKTMGVLAKAKAKLEENQDDVKEMNQMMMYSKVVTVRDAQVQEKRYIHLEKQEEDAQVDAMMEIERLKALKMYEERNKVRLEDQRSGASVIIEQIKERQAQRLREEEQRDQERDFILKQIQAMKDEEVEQQKAKKLAAGKLMEEVAIANEATLKIKEEKILAEKLEDQRILEYQRAKEQREREIEAEKRRIAEEKEAETTRLRAMQEKAQNKAGEMDALRAKRAFEAAERAARSKEAQEAARVEAINEELSKARKKQTAEKERRLAEQAKAERDEFDRIIEVQILQEDAEKKKASDEMAQRYSHCKELKKQIAAKEEKYLQERRNFLEEGNSIRLENAKARANLEGIKKKKIDELKRAGVPEKYWSELARKKIAV